MLYIIQFWQDVGPEDAGQRLGHITVQWVTEMDTSLGLDTEIIDGTAEKRP